MKKTADAAAFDVAAVEAHLSGTSERADDRGRLW